jgi:hypothetical protein
MGKMLVVIRSPGRRKFQRCPQMGKLLAVMPVSAPSRFDHVTIAQSKPQMGKMLVVVHSLGRRKFQRFPQMGKLDLGFNRQPLPPVGRLACSASR